ncbi:MAG: alpha/beta hydrolase [Kofleriaceae bacterium]|nr:MAG: alpha/beta hydrolase [Kofleriaceae bacterium]
MRPVMSVPPIMDEAKFERDRLELFRAHGFEGQSRWLADASLGIRTYAIARGESRCPTLLVHGGIADASVWYRMAGHLAGPVVIVDRPGHGLTTGIDYTGLDYRQHAVAWMKGVVDALGVEQVDLVGNSMGGYFSAVFALAHPERVRRVVLAGAPAGADRELPAFLRMWGRPIIGHLISAMMRGTKTPADMRKRVFASMCAHPERISDEALHVKLAAGTRPGWHPMVRSMIRAVSDLGGWRPALSIREAMTELAAPTLFAWGDKDSFAPPRSGEELAARMPAARVEVLADAGHLPQLDQPEALATCIDRFLAVAGGAS